MVEFTECSLFPFNGFYITYLGVFWNKSVTLSKTKNLYDITNIHISVNSMVHIKTKV